jgi:enoyl-CoA hydratase/carnithine racemase
MNDVRIERDGATLLLELDCPEKANALTADAVEAMLDALSGSAAQGLSLAVFSGRGRNFSSGFDIGGVAQATDGDLLFRMVRIETLLQAVHHAPFVTLGLAHGNVVGAGSDLLCACSLRVAAPESTFLMPGWRFGVALGTRRLMQRIGVERARHWLMESRRIDADRAVEWGFVDRVAKRAAWPEVRRDAERLASTLPHASMVELHGIGPDTRADDMATLVRTAGRPGLQQRMLDYMKAQRPTRS